MPCGKKRGQGRGDRRPPVAPCHRAAGGDSSFDVDQVFQGDRHAVQRPHRMAGADRLVGGLGGEPGILGIDADIGVEFRVVGGDAGEECLDDGDRRQPARGDLAGQLVRRQVARVGIGKGHRAHFG